jgi:S1-C subfamily serine protease
MAYDAPSSVLAQLSDELQSVVARVSPSIVSISHGRGQGSGFVLTPDGLLVTNHHVVSGHSGAVRVGLSDGRQLTAAVVGRDAPTDLAVLQVPVSDLPALTLLQAEQIAIGQLVIAIGNPLRFERSVSLGVVSAVDRTLPAAEGGMLEGLIQTDAAINPGNSGGPLVDVRGAVAGINTAMIPRAQGLGFAIPAQTASWVAATLIRDGQVRRPYFGIAARGIELPAAIAAATWHRRAVLVSQVVAGSPAAAAGLRPDDLILKASGEAVSLIDDLQRICVLAKLKSVELSLWRRGRVEAATVRLGPSRPAG